MPKTILSSIHLKTRCTGCRFGTFFGDLSQKEKLSEIKPPLVEPQSSVYIICLVAGQCGMANKLRIMEVQSKLTMGPNYLHFHIPIK